MPSEDTWRKINTLLRIYMHIPDPDALDDDTWAMRWMELKWACNAGFLPIKLN